MPAKRRKPVWPPWNDCRAVPDCIGKQLDPNGSCFAHADKDRRAAILKQLHDGAPLDFLQGVELTEELLSEVLEAVPRTDDGRLVLHDAQFQGASLPFIDLKDAVFKGNASFDEASFEKGFHFWSSTFQGRASFQKTTFHLYIGFEGVTFQENVSFDNARFQGTAWFLQACFEKSASFQDTVFESDALFHLTKFDSYAWFRKVRFEGPAHFIGASFQQPLDFGPAVVVGLLQFDKVTFIHPIYLQATAGKLSCWQTRFQGGGHLRVAYAEITLEEAEVTTPLIVSRYIPPDLWGRGALPPTQQPTDGRSLGLRQPLLLSVERADVAKLTLTDLDLSSCRFVGAHHLDQLTINGKDVFHRAPARRGSGRQVIAEECIWRGQGAGRGVRRWQEIHPSSFEGQSPADPAELVGVYRQLRKGREDAKNEPGAADFYYGECEMRRQARSTPWAERAILTIYWLFSGYGLRAARSLLVLLTMVLATIGLLVTVGLPIGTPAQRAVGTIRTAEGGEQAISLELRTPTSTSHAVPLVTDGLGSALRRPRGSR